MSVCMCVRVCVFCPRGVISRGSKWASVRGPVEASRLTGLTGPPLPVAASCATGCPLCTLSESSLFQLHTLCPDRPPSSLHIRPSISILSLFAIIVNAKASLAFRGSDVLVLKDTQGRSIWSFWLWLHFYKLPNRRTPIYWSAYVSLWLLKVIIYCLDPFHKSSHNQCMDLILCFWILYQIVSAWVISA